MRKLRIAQSGKQVHNHRMSTPASSADSFANPFDLPTLIFGSSALGNLYEELDTSTKLQLVHEWFKCAPGTVCIDSAGKYGAGLALEEIGDALRAYGRRPVDFLLSNKLGWKRVPLRHDEPQFEKGIWKGLSNDAVQVISYDGILECWEQGNELLGEPYQADLVSVHDPDEYLAAARDVDDRVARLADVLDAYRALSELRDGGKVRAIGVGAKDWTVILELARHVAFDWVMFAGSLTIYSHPAELLESIRGLASRSVAVINSAVFHSGFLVGGGFFDYRPVTREEDPELFAWRDSFRAICAHHRVRAVDACVEYALAPAGVVSIAMNTARPARICDNLRAVESKAPHAFWADMKQDQLIQYLPEDLR